MLFFLRLERIFLKTVTMASVKYNVYLWRNFFSWKWKSPWVLFFYVYLSACSVHLQKSKSCCLYVPPYNLWSLYIIDTSRGCTMIPTNVYKSASLPLAFVTDSSFLTLPCRAAASVTLLSDLSHFLIPMLPYILPDFRVMTMEITWVSYQKSWKPCFNNKSHKKEIHSLIVRKSGCAPYATKVTWVVIWWSLCKLCNTIDFHSPFSLFSPYTLSNYRWETFQSRNIYFGWSSFCLFGQDSNSNKSVLKYWPVKNLLEKVVSCTAPERRTSTAHGSAVFGCQSCPPWAASGP